MTVHTTRREVPVRTPGIEYLPGLDGLRALAVMAVIVYHADSSWLPGGFLGVEVFFVVSGYLITRLLVDEFGRTGNIDLVPFWVRRARRLLPALFVTLVGVLVATAVFRPDAAGRVRGDLVAGAGYVANWYQIWVGAGYSAAGDFAPLRHLWSLAIEEQFYLVWPIVVLWLLRRGWSRTAIAVASVFTAVVSVLLTAALVPSGPIADCTANPSAFWIVGGRCISIADALYLSTFTRGSGLLLGAALALVATHRRTPLWNVIGDVSGATGAAVLVAMSMTMHFSATGVHPFLFRGGFLLVDLATLLLIAAVARPRTITAQALSARSMLWIGTRSYGLYLYHWPIFQLVRRVAGNPLPLWQFALAVALTGVLAEASYRLIEMPIRRHGWRVFVAQFRRSPRVVGRNWSVGVATVVVLAVGVSAVRLATAEHRPNEIAAGLAAGADEIVSVEQLLAGVQSPPGTITPSAAGRPAAPNRVVIATSTTTTQPNSTTTRRATTPATTSPPTTTQPTTTRPTTTQPATTQPAAEPVTTTTATVVTTTTITSTTTATTAAPITSPPATSLPAEPPSPGDVRVPMLGIGDSVMLGAAAELTARGWVVNAQVSRQMIDTVPVLEQLRDAGVFGDVVLLHLGTNGSISDQTLDAALAALADVPLVVLVTVKANRSWAAGTSEKIRQRAGGNVVVLDWAAEAGKCPGSCFEDDGIHLRAAGRRFYADLVTWTLATAASR